MPRHNDTHVGNAARRLTHVWLPAAVWRCAPRMAYAGNGFVASRSSSQKLPKISWLAQVRTAANRCYVLLSTRACAQWGCGAFLSACLNLPVRVRACVCVRAQSFSRANEMVERLKDQTNYVLDKCA